MQRSEQVNEIFAALSRAQGKVQGAHKDSANPHFRSKYADLESCWDACREALADNGLAVTQEVTTSEYGVSIVTLLAHASGQWIEYAPLFIPSKADAHGAGSGATYGRRYALCAVVGIAPTDDDGNDAVGIPPQGQPSQPSRGPNREPPKMPAPPARPAARVEPTPAPKAPEPPPVDSDDPGPAAVEERRVVVDPENDKPKPATLLELKRAIDAAKASGMSLDEVRALALAKTGKTGAEVQKSESAAQTMIAALKAVVS